MTQAQAKALDKLILQDRLTTAIKPYIVRRPDGGCQVLFPLSELDAIVDQALRIPRSLKGGAK